MAKFLPDYGARGWCSATWDVRNFKGKAYNVYSPNVLFIFREAPVGDAQL